jgi:hypothetical protein
MASWAATRAGCHDDTRGAGRLAGFGRCWFRGTAVLLLGSDEPGLHEAFGPTPRVFSHRNAGVTQALGAGLSD